MKDDLSFDPEAAKRAVIVEKRAEKAKKEAEKLRELEREQQRERERLALIEKKKQEEIYWRSVLKKNKEALKKDPKSVTLPEVIRDCHYKSIFLAPRVKETQAKSIKAKLLRMKKEADEKKVKEEERRLKQENLKDSGASWQERMMATQLDQMSDQAAEALKKRLVEQKAQEEQKAKQAQLLQARREKAREDARKKKLQQEAHIQDMLEKSHWQKSGCKYWGDLTEYGEKHGYGEFEWKDGHRVYEGGYSNGNFQGKGRYEWGDGSTWQGRFSNDQLHGLGLRSWKPDPKKEAVKRWSFFDNNQMICWRDELVPGRRIQFLETRGRVQEAKSGTVIRSSTEDETSDEFLKGTFLIQFDFGPAKWN